MRLLSTRVLHTQGNWLIVLFSNLWENPSMKEVFTRAAENIFRYKNGNLYLSVKIDGKRM